LRGKKKGEARAWRLAVVGVFFLWSLSVFTWNASRIGHLLDHHPSLGKPLARAFGLSLGEILSQIPGIVWAGTPTAPQGLSLVNHKTVKAVISSSSWSIFKIASGRNQRFQNSGR